MGKKKKSINSRPPARRKRTRLSPEDRRREFIREATDYFSEKGFDGGTRELTQRLGVTQSLLYRYFPSKDHLIKEVYRKTYLEPWDPEWERILSDRSRPMRARLEDFYRAYTDVIFTRRRLRLYLFAGLKGLALNRWYLSVVQERILTRIIQEYRHEVGLPPRKVPSPIEIELAWALQNGIYYYGVRKLIYKSTVLENKDQVIAAAVSMFLYGVGHILGVDKRKAAERRTR